MAKKQFTQKQKQFEYVKWDGKNVDEVRELVPGASLLGTSIMITGKQSASVVRKDECIVKNIHTGELLAMSEEDFKANYEEVK